MLNNPRIYVAGKMGDGWKWQRWTSVLSESLRQSIETPNIDLHYPDEVGFSHEGDSPTGIVKADIELLDTCNGIISIFSEIHQPGTLIETLHALTKRKLALILFTDESYDTLEPHKLEGISFIGETNYWFLVDYIYENINFNKNMITMIKCRPEQVPETIKKWLQQFEAQPDLVMQFNAKIASIELREKDRGYPPVAPHAQKIWEKLKQKYETDFTCDYCDDSLKVIDRSNLHNKGFTFDHIKPLCKGGQSNPENLAIVCHECNIIKGTMDHQTYIDFLEKTKDDPELRRRMFSQMWTGRKAARFYRQ